MNVTELSSLARFNLFRHARFAGFFINQFRNTTTINAYFPEKSTQWKTVVGLEIHAQIASQSKLFSRSSTDFKSLVNSTVALLDASIPGTLPVLNKRCVEAAVLTSLALNCKLNPVSTFDRKHYFYPDLPAGYQITQQYCPLAYNGEITFPVSAVGTKTYMKTARIKQLQLEQDSGRTFLDETSGRKLVDLNRAGVPLMELVFEPDLKDGEEAAALVKELCLIFELLGTCGCRMEEGNLRVDANVSVHREGEPMGVRTEVKNISSVRAIANAIQWEANRQIRVLESGDKVINETRTWDRERACTSALREKESNQDYRYMPEPNLPPLRLQMCENEPADPHRVNVPRLKRSLPELPCQTRTLLLERYGLIHQIVAQFLDNRPLLRLFLTTMEDNPRRNARTVAIILAIHFWTSVSNRNVSVEESNLTIQALGEIEEMLSADRIMGNTCAVIFEAILDGSELSPKEIIDKSNLWKITDPKVLDAVCQSVISANPKLASKKTAAAVNILVSLIMADIKRAADRTFVAERVCKNLGLEENFDLSQVNAKKKKKPKK